MLIVCPNCATSYDVDVATLRPAGRQVRCVRCRSIWQAELSHADKLIAAAEELAPVRRAVEAVAEAVAGAPPPEPVAEPSETRASVETERSADDPPPDAPIDDSHSDAAPGPDVAAATDTSVEVDSPPIAPADHDTSETPITVEPDQIEAASAPPFEDIETIAARRYTKRGKRKGLHWPLSHLQSAMLVLIIVDAIVVGWRADFVRAMPQTASFYAWIGVPVNLRGLDFDSLATSTEQHDGVPILVVAGNIVNDTGKTADVPHIRLAVRNAAQQELYSWTAVPSRMMLPPGEAVAFRSRLASPPPDAHDVLVRFVNRNDILTGNR
jgi:predicted Zn finger-like uncharacterized protein